MSFNTQHTHEVRSLALKSLQANKEQLVHLESIPVAMANYQLKRGWLGSCTISQRFPDIEALPESYTLGTHLLISNAERKDQLAVSVPDFEAIQRAIAF